MSEEDLEERFINLMERWWAARHVERHGLVTSYDPKRYLAKVTLQPEGQETGWIPIETGHIGSTYGIVVGLQPGQGGVNGQGQGGAVGPQSQNQGDQVIVRFQEGDFESGKIVQRVHSDQDQPPQAQSGEIRIWTKFQKSSGPTPDSGQGGQGGTGQEHYFKNDGSLTHTDGNGATTVYDGNGNKTNTSADPGKTQTTQVTQGQGSPPGGGGLGDIVSQLSGMVNQLTALSNAGVGLPAVQSMGSQLSSTDMASSITGAGGSTDIAGAIGNIGLQISALTSMSGLPSLITSLTTQLTDLTNMVGSSAQVLHLHVLDRIKGIIASAFQDQHKTIWDKNGITHSSSTAVTSNAPKIPHNGLTTVSNALQVTGITSAQGFSMLSDRRLKTKVRKHRPVLEDVLKLRLKTFIVKAFNWDTGEIVEDGARSSLGFIAQQFRKVFPELVRQDNKYLSIEEDKLGPILVSALQEFVAETRAEITALRQEIAELKRR